MEKFAWVGTDIVEIQVVKKRIVLVNVFSSIVAVAIHIAE